MSCLSLDQPKKPVGGAFGAFLTEKRPEYLVACKGQKASAVCVMASKAWKELSDAEKKPYEEKYTEKKAKFDRDMEEFLAAGGEKAKKTKKFKDGKKEKKSKDPNKPKAPVGGAFGVFLAENRAKIVAILPKDHKITDVPAAASAQWKALPEQEKLPYETKFAKKQEEYRTAMETYTPPVAPVVEDAVKETPAKKRAAPEKATPSPAAKRGRGAKKATTSKEVEIDEKVLKEAEDLKLVSQIKNLLARAEVISSGKSHTDILEALKTNDGLVNKAKAVLLGA